LAFIQHTPHKAKYTSWPIALTFASHSKKIQKVVHPTRSLQQQWPPHQTKNGNPSIVFSVLGTGGSPTGPGPENRMCDLLSCKCPVSQGTVMQKEDPFGDLPTAFFLQNVLQLHQQR